MAGGGEGEGVCSLVYRKQGPGLRASLHQPGFPPNISFAKEASKYQKVARIYQTLDHSFIYILKLFRRNPAVKDSCTDSFTHFYPATDELLYTGDRVY
jgi:hypothetical protein